MIIFKNKLIYFGFAALMGILSIYIHLFLFLILFCLLSLWLWFIKKWTTYPCIFLFLLFFVFFTRAQDVYDNNHSKLTETQTDFRISFINEMKVDGDRWTVIGKEKTKQESILLSYKIETEEEKAFFINEEFIGKSCILSGTLEKPNAANNTNGFDYQVYLQNKSIHWILQVENITSCSTESFELLTYLKALREKGIDWTKEHFSHETSPVANALLFGDRDLLDQNIQDAYQKLGIIHLLAISGSHVVVLVGFLFFILLRLGMTKEKSVNLLLILLPAYSVLTGLGASIIRAVFFMMLILIKTKSPRLSSISSVDLLSIVSTTYLFFQPSMIFDIGFLLSFTVCFALLLSSSLLTSHDHPIKMYLFTTFISEYAVLPILLYYFYEIPTLSLLANLLYIPLYSIVLLPYLLIVFTVSFIFPSGVMLLLIPIDYILSFSDAFAVLVSKIPYSTLILGRPNLLFMVIYVISLPLFFYLYEKVNKKTKKCLYFIPVFILLLHFFVHNWSFTGEISFINVGQGDSVFIKLPYNRGIYLIDTGGFIEFPEEEWKEEGDPFEIGEDIVVPFLKSKGINTLDKLILTHGDADHISGSLAIIEHLKVKEILYPRTDLESGTLAFEVLELAKRKKINVTFVQSGQKWNSGNNIFRILAPNSNNVEDKNASSIVISTFLGGENWLFTGDLENEGEDKLQLTYPELKVDILKVAHHGSNSSTSQKFLDAYQPEIAIISVGEKNRYGHPNKQVMERLQTKKITIWRTDVHGTITYKYSQKTGTFYLQHP